MNSTAIPSLSDVGHRRSVPVGLCRTLLRFAGRPFRWAGLRMSGFWAVAAGLALSGTGLNAGIIFDSITTKAGSMPVASDGWRAQSFKTDNNNYSLSSVKIYMNNAGGSTDGFILELWSAASGHPSSQIARLTGSIAPTVAGNYTYLPGSTINLDPLTTYCVVAGTYGGTFDANTTTTAPSVGSTDYGYSASYNLGVSWSPPSTPANGMLMVQVNVEPVPEPANVALGVFAAVGLVIQGGRAWRRRRQK
jgi:hypothetical protein